MMHTAERHQPQLMLSRMYAVVLCTLSVSKGEAITCMSCSAWLLALARSGLQQAAASLQPCCAVLAASPVLNAAWAWKPVLL